MSNRKHRLKTALHRSARRLSVAAVACACLITHAAHADVVKTIEGQEFGGVITLAKDADALTVTSKAGQVTTTKLEDLAQASFGSEIVIKREANLLLIDNDRGRWGQVKTAQVKLKPGLHRFVIPYWQNKGEHKLQINVTGPGNAGTTELGVQQLFCFRDADENHDPSPGFDAAGFRLPELSLDAASDKRRFTSRARYRLFTGDENLGYHNVGVIGQMTLKRSGTSTALNTGMVNNNDEHFGIIFEGFFKAEEEGVYTFALVSDDGSQLYFGEADTFLTDQMSKTPVHTPWRAELHQRGLAKGMPKTIADDKLIFHIPLVSDVEFSLAQVRELWDQKADPAAINRSNEPTDLDTVYIRDKTDPAKIISISGRVAALSDESLAFIFRDKPRTITRDRVAGMVFAHADRPALPDPGFYQVLGLKGGQALPVKIKSIDDTHAHFELIGGGPATPPRDVLVSMRCENGRLVDLTRAQPLAEEAVPYFGLTIPSRINESFAGEPIRLFDLKTYEYGIAVHSKSRLHYKLDRPAQSFNATFGMMAPGGKLGNVTARVLGDGKVLWEQADITADTPPIKVNVPLEGVERLILEVDFGKGQDVGDRAAWCSPQLIFPAKQD